MGLLTDQVAVLTGAGRGIGRAVALAMAAEGARVVVADAYQDADGSAADLVAAKISAAGGVASAVTVDVASEEGISAIFDEAAKQADRVDIVCTFAGNYIPKAFDTMTVSELASLLNVHVDGTFRAIQAAYSFMQPAGYGRIMTVASRGAFPHPDDSRDVPPEKQVTLSAGYSAAKAAIMGLTAAVATDLAGQPEDITVSCLLPSAQTQLFPGSVPRAAGGFLARPTSTPQLWRRWSSTCRRPRAARSTAGSSTEEAVTLRSCRPPREQPRARRCSARPMSGALAISRLCLARWQVLAARDGDPGECPARQLTRGNNEFTGRQGSVHYRRCPRSGPVACSAAGQRRRPDCSRRYRGVIAERPLSRSYRGRSAPDDRTRGPERRPGDRDPGRRT